MPEALKRLMLLEEERKGKSNQSRDQTRVNLWLLLFGGSYKKQTDARRMPSWSSCYWIGESLMLVCCARVVVLDCVSKVAHIIPASEVFFSGSGSCTLSTKCMCTTLYRSIYCP